MAEDPKEDHVTDVETTKSKEGSAKKNKSLWEMLFGKNENEEPYIISAQTVKGAGAKKSVFSKFGDALKGEFEPDADENSSWRQRFGDWCLGNLSEVCAHMRREPQDHRGELKDQLDRLTASNGLDKERGQGSSLSTLKSDEVRNVIDTLKENGAKENDSTQNSPATSRDNVKSSDTGRQQ